MKNIFKKLACISLILVLALLCFAACGQTNKPDDGTDDGTTDDNGNTDTDNTAKYALILEASKTELSRGDVVTFSSVFKADGKEDLPSEDATYTITSGSDYATLIGNTLTVLNTAPHGAEIKVKATEGATPSNELTLTVSVPAESIVISATGDVTNINAGASVILNATIAPAGADSNITWQVTEGADSATISGNVLVVNSTAVTGTTIKVKATLGELSSNELSFTVGIPLETITISAIGSRNILAGSSAQVNVIIDPETATNGSYRLVFVNDCSAYATVAGSTIIVADNAETGATIQVKAVAGDIESNVITYTVGYPLESLTAALLGEANVNPGKTAHLSVTLNPTNATNGAYEWVFVEGEGKATIANNVLTVSSEAVTGDVIKIKAVAGTVESNVIEITVGIPLETLTATLLGEANVNPGKNVHLSVALDPTNATNGAYEWVFVEGEGKATIVDNVLTVASAAVTGDIIKIKAVAGAIESNVIEIIVGYPLESLTASVIGSSNVEPGNSASLSVTLNPTNATNGAYEWVFTEGGNYATISNNVLSINSATPAGTVIKFKAVAGTIESNEVSVVAGTPITGITISSTAPAILDRSGSYSFAITAVEPENASVAAIEWVSSSSYATFSGNTLYVAANTPAGTVVEVYAASGSVTSNVLTYTVGIPLESITISMSGSANVDPDTSRVISSTLNPSNASDTVVTWVIEEGGDYATIVNGVLTVNSDAPIGATVKFHAEIGSVKSNDISIIVGIPLESITISMSGSANVDPDGSRVISATLNPTNATNKVVTWVIDEGADYAAIVNGVLTVNSDAPIGATVKFHAEIGNVESNQLSITVGVPVTSIGVSAVGSTTVVKGDSVALAYTLNPTNATATTVTWAIIEGAEYATLVNGVLTVNSDATTGAVIKVQASVYDGAVVSEPLSITVRATQEEINKDKLMIDLSATEITLDKKGMSTPVVNATILDANLDTVTNVNVQYEVTSGAQYLAVTYSNNKCNFTALGHGTATVTASIPGRNVSKTINVTVIVPPDRVDLPEVFRGDRANIEYAFSKVDALPFVPSVYSTQELACKDIVMSFTHADGTTGDSVAVYENGEITFKMKGRITVNVSSNSGSRVEATNSYVFNINEGINVYNYTDLRNTVESSTYNGQEINFVILEKPVGYDPNYSYGYDLVPPAALVDLYAKYADKGADAGAYVLNDIIFGVNRVQAVDKSLWINGNNHKVNASQMQNFTAADRDRYLQLFPGRDTFNPQLDSLISVEPDYEKGDSYSPTHTVRLYNMLVEGNCPVDYKGDVGNGTANGMVAMGISIGNTWYDSKYEVDIDNVEVSKFQTGLNLNAIVGDGTISNITAYNCYGSGVRVKSSIVTFENMTFGTCGAPAIEVAPERCNEAGANRNEVSKVTFKGTIDAEDNLIGTGENGSSTSRYFENYKLAGVASALDLIKGNLTAYPAELRSHLVNSNGQANFIALKFYDFTQYPIITENTTQIVNTGFGATGIISMTDIVASGAINTTHEYISMTIMLDLALVGGSGTVAVGEAIFYNMNYNGN